MKKLKNNITFLTIKISPINILLFCIYLYINYRICII